ncbi:MAG: hypothetical protein ACRYG2_27690 [Janthinobacterium lividum]
MSVAFAEPVLDRPTADLRWVGTGPVPAAGAPRSLAPSRPAPTRTRPRRTGPGVGPTARPRRLRFSAPAVAAPLSRPRSCEPSPVVAASRSWHLTERGLAVVLVVAAALVAASIAVVGLTALRITSDSYHPGHSAVAPVVVEP